VEREAPAACIPCTQHSVQGCKQAVQKVVQLLYPAAVLVLYTVTSMSGAADAKLAQWLAGSSESDDTESDSSESSESSESRRQRGSGAGRGASRRARR
jgi:hypothetical protein